MKKIRGFFPKSFVRFLIVSLVGGGLDIGVYFALTVWFSVDFFVAGIGAFFTAAVSNFFFAKYWAFECRLPRVKKQFLKYLFIAGIGLVIHQVVLSFGMMWLDIPEIIIKLVASWAAVLWSYFLNARFTFQS